MTPINCILNNSKMVLESLDASKDKGGNKSGVHYNQLKKCLSNSYEMNKQIMYSAQILQFYNTNQIEKMKIARD